MCIRDRAQGDAWHGAREHDHQKDKGVVFELEPGERIPRHGPHRKRDGGGDERGQRGVPKVGHDRNA